MTDSQHARAAGVAAVLFALQTMNPGNMQAQSPRGVNRFVGTWVGVLAMPAAKLRLAFAITRDSAGQLAGVMTSVDQGNIKIPAAVSVNGDTLVVTMAAANASYTGVITGKDSLRGAFKQGMAIPLDLVRTDALPVRVRPQDPKAPFPYTTRDVSFESVPGVRLAGTVVLPPGRGPFPAVVLVTGSGAQDRNEEIVDHRPFLVIADYLARHGIASLRYDDRGFAKSTGNFAAGTTADFANDAEAAVNFLRKQPGIAPARVGIMGHSEGGMIAPMVAARTSTVAFIVLLAGPGVPGDSILLLQEALIAAGSGAPPAMVQRNTEVNTRLFDAIKSSRDSADAADRVSAISKRMVATLPVDQQALATTQLEAAAKTLLTPWMQYFIRSDPRPALRQVHVPVLALGGTLDLQVPYKQNLSAIDTALKAAGNRDYHVAEMPGLNHLFQTATTGLPAEYSAIAETFSPAALELIATWINERFHAGQ